MDLFCDNERKDVKGNFKNLNEALWVRKFP